MRVLIDTGSPASFYPQSSGKLANRQFSSVVGQRFPTYVATERVVATTAEDERDMHFVSSLFGAEIAVPIIGMNLIRARCGNNT